jgi:putative membrane-bound dehydrogenase-like protein
LNLATGIAFGHGGVFVLNVPYLLFYPDRNRDDRPDGDPEVLLAGFGMQDAHSVANSLTFGPDGWLYGCQGSTVTSRIRGIEFQQGVWRYHPRSRCFELFCEGGGNSWGLDFDPRGELLYATNWGGHVLVHGLQGASFVKAFAKHGPLRNRFAYGWLDHAPHESFRGGHVTVGGIVERGTSLPAWLRGRYVAGDLLGHAVRWHDLVVDGSGIRTRDGGVLLESTDPWFAPTDLAAAPDGAIWVTDWCDGRTAHPDPDAEWDRSNGRIYRIAVPGTPPATVVDPATLPLDALLADHDHPGQWFVRRARRELVRRQGTDPATTAPLLPALRQRATGGAAEATALEALWTLASLDALDEALALRLLDSPHAAVRAWTVRLIGDDGEVSDDLAHRLDRLAEEEPDVVVRRQVAASAARLPAAVALPLINAAVIRATDAGDGRMELLWWWALEAHVDHGRDEVLRRFVRPTAWASPLGREALLPRLVRRCAATGTIAGDEAAVALVAAAPTEADRRVAWGWIASGVAERNADATPFAGGPLGRAVVEAWEDAPHEPALMRLAIACRHPPALAAARATAFDARAAREDRVAALGLLAGSGDRAALAAALAGLPTEEDPAACTALVGLLATADDPRVPAGLVARLRGEADTAVAAALRRALLARHDGARALLAGVDRGEIAAATIDLEEVRAVARFADPALDAVVGRHWGRLRAATPEETLAVVRRLSNDLRAAPGDATAGEALFARHCGTCHRLFGKGGSVGPDLTAANRADRQALLVALVDPSATIRREYAAVTVETADGRVLSGIPQARPEGGVRLTDAKGGVTDLPAAAINAVHDAHLSLMPADILLPLSPQELRDLFAHLERKE